MTRKTKNDNELAETLKRLAEIQASVAGQLTPEQAHREGWFTAQFLDELMAHASDESSECIGVNQKK